MRRPARAYVDLSALRHNLTQARARAPHSRIVAMVKADAYGHGMIEAAAALVDTADALGVACVTEAVALREAGIDARVMVTQGFKNAEELRASAQHVLDVVVHSEHQLGLLETCGFRALPALWIKVDSGMHRLGFSPEKVAGVYIALKRLPGLTAEPGLITHFACADVPEHPLNTEQMRRFNAAVGGLPGERSVANSAAVLAIPDAHLDWNRPGIMLYGSSPLGGVTSKALGLRPVMHLHAPLIAVNRHRRGESIGYGATYACPEDMPVGVVGIGYGDGYPRHAGSGTPVMINGHRTSIVGRVSMDMLVIDLRGIKAQIGDQVELWGDGVLVDEVALHAQTIGYELLCHAGSITHRTYG